jgi:hypothetical protein
VFIAIIRRVQYRGLYASELKYPANTCIYQLYVVDWSPFTNPTLMFNIQPVQIISIANGYLLIVPHIRQLEPFGMPTEEYKELITEVATGMRNTIHGDPLLEELQGPKIKPSKKKLPPRPQLPREDNIHYFATLTEVFELLTKLEKGN